MFRILTYSANVFMEQIKERAWRLTKILIASYVPHQDLLRSFLMSRIFSHLSSFSDISTLLHGEILISIAETVLMVSISVLNLS